MACLKTTAGFTIAGLPDNYRNRNVVSKVAYIEHICDTWNQRLVIQSLCEKREDNSKGIWRQNFYHQFFVNMFVLCRRNTKR
jgi:hypothetical protein